MTEPLRLQPAPPAEPRGRPVAATMAALALALGGPPARADDCRATLRYDAAADRATLVRDGRSEPVEDGAVLPYAGPTCVEVVGLSTGLQHAEVSAEASDTSGLQGLLGLIQGFRPVGKQTEQAVSGVRDLSRQLGKLRAERGPLQRALEEVQALSEGPGGVAAARAAARVTAARMAADPGRTEPLGAELRERLGPSWGCPPGAPAGCPPRLLPALGLVDAYAALDAALQAYLQSPLAEQEPELTEAALRVLADVPAALAGAREAEALVRAVVESRGLVRRGPLRPGVLAGLEVRVAVTPRGERWLEWLSLPPPRGLRVTFRDRAGARISAGALAVFVPTARLPRYGNVGGALGRSGTTDARPQLGLSLDVSARWLDWSDAGGPTIWLPQLLVTPVATSAPGFGLGAAATFGQLKASAGAIWLQRDRPGAPLGTPIGPGEDVPVSRGYDAAPRLYLALGVRLP
mgnify:CR=1 FL=1